MSLEALYSPKTVVFIIRNFHHSILSNPLYFRSPRNALNLNGLYHQDVLVLRDKHNVGLEHPCLLLWFQPHTPQYPCSFSSPAGICNLEQSKPDSWQRQPQLRLGLACMSHRAKRKTQSKWTLAFELLTLGSSWFPNEHELTSYLELGMVGLISSTITLRHEHGHGMARHTTTDLVFQYVFTTST